MDKDLEGYCKKSNKIAADDQSVSTMESLPYEITLNILSRLPVTTLLQAKLVCRSWKNSVRDPLLVLMNFSHLSEKDPSLIMHFKFPIQSQLYFVSNCGHIEDMATAKRIILPDMLDFVVAGSCNGLICFYDLPFKNPVCVFNPFTRNYLKLPEAEHFSRQLFVSFGFGFLPTTTEYKVVRIVYYKKNEEGYPVRSFSLRSNVQILCLRSSSWRSIGQSPYQLERITSRALVNGRLHWLTLQQRRVQQPLRMIVSFDLADEQFRIVPEPNSILLRRRRSHLVILRGCLSLAAYTANAQLDIWIMKEYDVRESWVKSFSIGSAYLPKELSQNEVQSFNISESYINPAFVRVLCVLENGKILLNYKARSLLLYEPKSSTFKQLLFPGLPNLFEPTVHIGSLNWIDTHQ